MLRPVLAIVPAFSAHQIFEIEPSHSHGDGDPDNGPNPKQPVTAASFALAAGEPGAVEASQAATAGQAAAAEGVQLPDGQARGEGRGDREAAGGALASAIMPFTASVLPFELGWYVVSEPGGEGTSQKRGPSTSVLDTEGGAGSRAQFSASSTPVSVVHPGGNGCSQRPRLYM